MRSSGVRLDVLDYLNEMKTYFISRYEQIKIGNYDEHKNLKFHEAEIKEIQKHFQSLCLNKLHYKPQTHRHEETYDTSSKVSFKKNVKENNNAMAVEYRRK